MWYPKKQEGDVSSLRAELTELDPQDYYLVVHEMSISEMMIWVENSWLKSKFDEMEDDLS